MWDKIEPRGGCNKEWWLRAMRNKYFNGIGPLEDRMFTSIGDNGNGYIDYWRKPPVKPNSTNIGFQGRTIGDSKLICLNNWKEKVCQYMAIENY